MKNKYIFIISGLLIIAVATYMIVSNRDTSDENKQLADQLFTSIYNGDKDEVKKIIKDNKDIINMEKDNKTSLEASLDAQQYQIAIFLLEEGAKTSLPSFIAASQSLLDYEHLRNGITEDQKERVDYYEALLKKNKELISEQDEYGNTALHIAAQKGDVEVCELLLKHGANLTLANKSGQNPLHMAVGRGSLETAKIIYKRNQEVTYEHNQEIVKAKDKNGSTILHIAIENRRYELYDWILKVFPESINMMNNEGMTPLSKASAYGDVETVSYLLQHGADRNIRSKEGLLPLDYASQNKNTEIMQLLKAQ